MKLRNLNRVPVGGWSYVEFENGVRTVAGSFDELVEAVLIARASNGTPRATLREVYRDVEEQICKRQAKDICAGCDFEPARLSAGNIYDAAIAMSETLKENDFVSQDEADTRADLCSRCYHNQPSTGCFGRCIDMLKSAFHSLLGDRITKSEGKLNSCEVCGCSCKTIVWIKKDILNEKMTEKQRIAHKNTGFCWKM